MKRVWTYKGFNIYPAETNGSGIRWYALTGSGYYLRSSSKAGMRQLINKHLASHHKA